MTGYGVVMQREFENIIFEYIAKYSTEHNVEHIWQKPVVKFADAHSEHIRNLRNIVVDDHYLPTDFLPDAKNVLSYYLPFKKHVADSNIKNRLASAQWANAYNATNEMVPYINSYLLEVITTKGYGAAVPQNIGIISNSMLMSRWSQRHIAWIAGHGTFGINNMLISEKGCCGRYFSIVTSLPVIPDQIMAAERCLFKSKGNCGVCVDKCMAGALTTQSYNREQCREMCMENDAIYNGADVCGKCVVGLPCSFNSLS